jgi:hypothetical protein
VILPTSAEETNHGIKPGLDAGRPLIKWKKGDANSIDIYVDRKDSKRREYFKPLQFLLTRDKLISKIDFNLKYYLRKVQKFPIELPATYRLW